MLDITHFLQKLPQHMNSYGHEDCDAPPIMTDNRLH